MNLTDPEEICFIILDCRRLVIEGFDGTKQEMDGKKDDHDDEKMLIKFYPPLCSGQIHAIMKYANSPLNAKEFSKRVSSISIKTKKEEIKEIMEASNE